MAIPASGAWFKSVIITTLDGTAAFDFDTTNLQYAALFTSACDAANATYYPNGYDTLSGYGAAPFNANEIANGSGYTTSGAALSATDIVAATPGIAFTSAPVAWPTSSILNAWAALVYVKSNNKGIVLTDFGGAYTSSSGTFTLSWPSNTYLKIV